MLINIEDVQVGDYVSVPLYLVENTRLPYPLFKVELIDKEEGDKGIKYVLYDDHFKPLLMRSKGNLVQYRGKLRDGLTVYKTGDRLPIGDLLPLMINNVFTEPVMMQVHDVLSNFQFIEFNKNSIRYESDQGGDIRLITFHFRHATVTGQAHIRIPGGQGVGMTMVVYETDEGTRKGNYYDEIEHLNNLVLE